MKLHFIILFFVTLGVFSQNENSEEEVFLLSVVDKKPEYPGGMEALTSFIAGNIDLPINNVFDGGRVIVSFTVNQDGVLSDIKIIKGFGLEVNSEIIRLMNLCKNWIPGEIASKKVRVNYVLPLVLPKSEIEEEIKKNVFEKDSISLSGDLDVKPEFKGGQNLFYDYVGKNFRVPMIEGIKGKVFASFVIEKDGSLNEIKIIRDEVGHGCSQEFIRVLKECPKWSPGYKDGFPKRVLYSMPLSIQGAGGPRTNELFFYDVALLDPNGKPEYPEGLEAFYNFIYASINPKKINDFKGKVNVYFTIQYTGKILKVHVEEKVPKEMYNEISRVIKSSKKWIPAVKYGEKVNCYYKLPISIGY